MLVKESKTIGMDSHIDVIDLQSVIYDDEKVSQLDPLHVDEFLLEDLPRINRRHDTTTLERMTRQIVPTIDVLASFSVIEARAATRDLGFIAGSLASHNISPNTVPPLEEALIVLSNTTQEVPRDTVFTYGPRNPTGERMRTFTDRPEERLFIDSFRKGMTTLPFSIISLNKANHLDNEDPMFAFYIREADVNLHAMVNAIVEVRKQIPPEVFTRELRPYFPTFHIGGVEYVAPGGAQMPVILIDYLLWGASYLNNPTYKHYFTDNSQYLPPHYRNFAAKVADQPSIIDKFSNHRLSESSELGVSALISLLNTIQKFRFPHKKVADENMAIRPEGSEGSGGYTTDILQFLMNQTLQAKNKLQEKQ